MAGSIGPAAFPRRSPTRRQKYPPGQRRVAPHGFLPEPWPAHGWRLQPPESADPHFSFLPAGARRAFRATAWPQWPAGKTSFRQQTTRPFDARPCATPSFRRDRRRPPPRAAGIRPGAGRTCGHRLPETACPSRNHRSLPGSRQTSVSLRCCLLGQERGHPRPHRSCRAGFRPAQPCRVIADAHLEQERRLLRNYS